MGESAVKHDTGKAPFELLPPDTLAALTAVLAYGQQKYAARNWEKGMSWGRMFGAAMRHLWSFWKGEELDPESGLPHIDHALCCVLFLGTYWRRKVGEDDRSKI